MKKTLFILLLLLLAACTPEQKSTENHIGCQEGEIIEGECIVAENNNAQLFGQNFSQSVQTQEITEEIQGFLAQPTQPGEYPGVLMIHEWWGLNDNIKEMAQILANEGYVVFAIDLYDGNVAATSEEARELVTTVRNNPETAINKMQQGIELLKAQGSSNIGSLGWCFGGQQSLLASINADVDATVIYYGNLVDNQTQLSAINGPILGIFGSKDSSIPVESVQSFESQLNQLGIANEIHIYQGVGHAFANPSGSNYAADETKDAWSKTTAFLKQHLE